MLDRFLGAVALVLIWQLVCAVGAVSPLLLAAPLPTARALVNDFPGIAQDVGATMARLGIGFAIGVGIGVPLGTILGLQSRLYAFFELGIDFFRSLPVVTLLPLAMMIFGLGDSGKIALTAWTVALLLTVSTIYGIKDVPQTRIWAAKTFGVSSIGLVSRVILPSALPAILGGMRLAISLGLVVVVLTEMLTGTINGLGKRIYEAGLVYETPAMYAAILVAGLLGYAMNRLILSVEGRVAHWRGQ